MEKLADILSEIKDRIRNPLIVSFVLSWLVCNWRVLAALIAYNEKNYAALKVNGYVGYVEQLNKNKDIEWVWPACLAILYTLSIPVFRMLNSALNTYFKKRSVKWNKKLSQQSSIPIDRYLRILDAYDQDHKTIEEVIVRESEYATKFREVQSEITALQSAYEGEKMKLMTDISESNSKIESLRKESDAISEEYTKKWEAFRDLDIKYSNLRADADILRNKYDTRILERDWKVSYRNGEKYVEFRVRIGSNFVTEVDSVSSRFIGIIGNFDRNEDRISFSIYEATNATKSSYLPQNSGFYNFDLQSYPHDLTFKLVGTSDFSDSVIFLPA